MSAPTMTQLRAQVVEAAVAARVARLAFEDIASAPFYDTWETTYELARSTWWAASIHESAAVDALLAARENAS